MPNPDNPPNTDRPTADELRPKTDGSAEWERFRAVAWEIDQLRLSGQGITATAVALHHFQVNVAHMRWSNDLEMKLRDTEELAKRVLVIIESLRRFTK